jgi:uncharacterized integral membrane protein
MTEETTQFIVSNRNTAGSFTEDVQTSLLTLAQKPLGIGIIGGSVTGFANSIVLGIPLLPSVITGTILGFAVCLVLCSGMKDELALRRKLVATRSKNLSKRVRIVSAFTAFD